jgi:hypothetical protein
MNSPNKFRSLHKLDAYLQRICYAGFSLAMLFFLFCVQTLFSHDRSQKTPQDLERLIKMAQEHINAEQIFHDNYDRFEEIAQLRKIPIEDNPYETRIWNSPLANTRKRSSPQLYSLQSLSATADYGAFFVRAEGGTLPKHPVQNEKPLSGVLTKGYRWVMVTGIIENYKQSLAFNEALAKSQYRIPSLEYPDYQYFQVERAEIAGNDTNEVPLRWEPRPVLAMYEVKNGWAGIGNDPVDVKYYPPPKNGIAFVFPLGPLSKGCWREEASHPRIALYEASTKSDGVIRPVSVAAPADHFAPTLDRMATTTPATDAYPARHNRQVLAAAEKPDIYFLRYIDYDVQPGKHYRYRIRLVLLNPNWHVPEKYLQNAILSKAQYLKTDWSEPTSVVTVPRSTKIHFAGTDARKGQAIVKLEHFDLQNGEIRTKEFFVEKGEVMNYYNQACDPSAAVSDPRKDESMELFPTPREKPKPLCVNFVTDKILIDFETPKRSPGRPRPTEAESIIVMDTNGNLSKIEKR